MLKQLLTLNAPKLATGMLTVILLGAGFGSFGQQHKASKGTIQMQLQALETSFKAGRQGNVQAQIPVSRLAAQSRPLTSTVYYHDGNSSWIQNYNGRYTYDAQGNQTSFTRLPLIPQNMAEKDSSRFDLHGNRIFDASYTFHQPSNAWVMNWGDRFSYTYNAAGNPTEQIYESWNNGLWEQNARIVTVYNSTGFPTEQTNYEWDNNSWRPEAKVIFSYTNPAAAPTGFVVQGHNNGNWTNELRFQNIVWHNINEFEMAAFEAQMWVGAFWINMIKSNAVYDPLGGSVTITQNWGGLAWQNSERETITHDAKMNFIGRKSETWQNNAWAFDYEHQELLTYNAADEITERILVAFDPSSSTMKPYQKEVYSTFLVMGAGKNQVLAGVKVYPNPAANYITVQLNTRETTQAILTDLSGRAVLNQTLPALETRLDLSGLAKGTYLLQLQTAKGTSLQKIIKQ